MRDWGLIFPKKKTLLDSIEGVYIIYLVNYVVTHLNSAKGFLLINGSEGGYLEVKQLSDKLFFSLKVVLDCSSKAFCN